MRGVVTILVLCTIVLLSCGSKKNKDMEETEVLIETSMGDIKVKLYNETPKHRDNFIRLAKEGVYDQILFHRVVRDFMVQAGDPGLKPQGQSLAVDTNTYKYTIPAEIVYPRYFHKRGALAAARMGDDVNPNRESSGTQFYIVTGREFSISSLMELYSAIYQQKVEENFEELSRQHMKELYLLRKKGQREQYEELKDSILKTAEESVAQNPPPVFTDWQKRAYTTVGGAPHLDGAYTVFGEVVSGIHVAEAISKVRTAKERPLQEVVIKKVTVLE